MTLSKLDHLGSLFQGLTVSRYIEKLGKSEPVVQIRHLDHYYVSTDLDLLNLDAPNIERYRLKINDVVLTVKGTTKKVSVVNQETENAIVGQNLAVFRPIPERINSLYFAVILRSQWINESLLKISGQSTGTRSISLKQLKQLEIPVPPLERQAKIAELFYSIEEAAIASMKEIEVKERMAELSLEKWLE